MSFIKFLISTFIVAIATAIVAEYFFPGSEVLQYIHSFLERNFPRKEWWFWVCGIGWGLFIIFKLLLRLRRKRKFQQINVPAPAQVRIAAPPIQIVAPPIQQPAKRLTKQPAIHPNELKIRV